MSLFHANYQKKYKPGSFQENPYMLLLAERIHVRSWDKLVRIFDEQIANISPSQSSALEFGMLATLVGWNSKCPSGDATYVWETVWKAAKGHQKTANYMLGTFAQWRFAEDSRQWLCFKKDTDRKNIDGEDMTVTIYWVKQPKAK